MPDPDPTKTTEELLATRQHRIIKERCAQLKTNLLGTATDGTVRCQARCRHAGRTTQVWDAEITHEEGGRTLALFRCTQLELRPRAPAPAAGR